MTARQTSKRNSNTQHPRQHIDRHRSDSHCNPSAQIGKKLFYPSALHDIFDVPPEAQLCFQHTRKTTITIPEISPRHRTPLPRWCLFTIWRTLWNVLGRQRRICARVGDISRLCEEVKKYVAYVYTVMFRMLKTRYLFSLAPFWHNFLLTCNYWRVCCQCLYYKLN
jgi:hypothetical protein